MALPLILGAAAAVAGVAGIGNAIAGAGKMIEAQGEMKSIKSQHEKNQARFEKQSNVTNADMDELGALELETLKSFEEFSDTVEKIHNRPQFKEYSKDGVDIPEYNVIQLKKVSVGAGALLSGLGGAALGTAGGYAASGAAMVAVLTLGTASTGTAIGTLSGVAATNAALAALGGGALAAGGGGMALGSTILGATTLGVGLLVGGIIFNLTGSALSEKVDEAYSQMYRAEASINRICSYLQELSTVAKDYTSNLKALNSVYAVSLMQLKNTVNIRGKTDWNRFTGEEKLCLENTALLVGLLYRMCSVKLVLQTAGENELNRVNHGEINKVTGDAKRFLESRGMTA